MSDIDSICLSSHKILSEAWLATHALPNSLTTVSFFTLSHLLVLRFYWISCKWQRDVFSYNLLILDI